jgi:hypothetical protein
MAILGYKNGFARPQVSHHLDRVRMALGEGAVTTTELKHVTIEIFMSISSVILVCFMYCP